MIAGTKIGGRPRGTVMPRSSRPTRARWEEMTIDPPVSRVQSLAGGRLTRDRRARWSTTTSMRGARGAHAHSPLSEQALSERLASGLGRAAVRPRRPAWRSSIIGATGARVCRGRDLRISHVGSRGNSLLAKVCKSRGGGRAHVCGEAAVLLAKVARLAAC